MIPDACGCLIRRRTVADFASQPRHAGEIGGATQRGEAARLERLVVWIGLWRDASGAVARARFRSTTCVSLMAYAELACELLEQGHLPAAVDAPTLHARLEGVHPQHRDRADLVVEALRAALGSEPNPAARPGGLL